MNEDDATLFVQAGARILMGAALELIQADPHQWSKRPCQTCRAVTAILGQPFGCNVEPEREGDCPHPFDQLTAPSTYDEAKCRRCGATVCYSMAAEREGAE